MGDDRDRIREAVKTSHLFEELSEASREQLIEAAALEKHDPGATILAEGETGDDLFLVLWGQVEVSVHVEGGDKKLARLGKGDVFGEIAGLIDHRRYATVTSAGKFPCGVVRFPRAPVDGILAAEAGVKDKLQEEGTKRLAEATEAVLSGAADDEAEAPE